MDRKRQCYSTFPMQWAWSLLCVLAACGLLLAGTPPPAQAQSQTTSPDIKTYEAWLREALVAAQRNDKLGLEESSAKLIETTRVWTTDDAFVSVDNQWLAEALNTLEPDFEHIAARLGALLDALAAPEPEFPADAQQQLQDMLNRYPFASEQPKKETWFTRLGDWFLRLLDRLLRPMGNVGTGPANLISWLVVGLGFVLIVGVIIYFLTGMRRSLARDARLTQDSNADDDVISATEAMNKASTLARGGDYRSAMRYLYLAALTSLDERGFLRYDPSLTNYEYLDHLTHPELRALLQPVVETFDRVWYGYAHLDAESFAHYQQKVEALNKVQKHASTS